jgi:hypothetical protein
MPGGAKDRYEEHGQGVFLDEGRFYLPRIICNCGHDKSPIDQLSIEDLASMESSDLAGNLIGCIGWIAKPSIRNKNQRHGHHNIEAQGNFSGRLRIVGD